MIFKVGALWESVMAIAMLFALATQLRFFGVGPGVPLLLIGLLAAFLSAFWRGHIGLSGKSFTLLVFWGVLAAATSLGSIASMVLGIPVDFSLVTHDVIAYALLTLVTLSFAMAPQRAESLRKMQWRVAIFGAVMSTLQFATAFGPFSLPNVDPWYWDRMRGWAENPNQFALLSLLIGFCSLALLEKCETRWQTALALLCAAVALVVGLQSKSNAYSMVVMLGILTHLALKAARVALGAERAGFPALGSMLAAAAAIGFLLTIASAAVSLTAELKSFAGDFARKGDDESADADLRLALWRQAIAVGWKSGGFGLGPGPHLAIPPSLVAARKSEDEPKNLVHPKVGLAPNFEAHNTLLELFVQGGVLAVAAFAAVLVTAVKRAWKAGEDGVIALLVSTIAFGSFHVVFRHPLVWFCLCLGILAERTPHRALAFFAKPAKPTMSNPLIAESGARP